MSSITFRQSVALIAVGLVAAGSMAVHNEQHERYVRSLPFYKLEPVTVTGKRLLQPLATGVRSGEILATQANVVKGHDSV